MINHFRTLLLNLASGNNAIIPASGEEYIDPSFSPIMLSGKLRDAQGVLIPAGASRADKNFYAYALMRFAHAPDFEQYVTLLDRRIVYDIERSLYLSADIARGTYPQFNTGTLYVSLASALMKPGASIFDMAPGYKDQMAVFKDVWHGNPSYKDKVTAGIMATVYAVEEVRTGG